MAGSSAPVEQPAFASQITNLKYPLTGTQFGTLQRGYMVWDSTSLPTGYSSAARVNFLFNPSTVTASYSLIPDTSVQAAMMFPTAYNNTDLRVPLSQTVEWSLLFDRTFELWGAYSYSDGIPIEQQIQVNAGTNNAAAVGVMVDINAMQQFTGMYANYYSGASAAQQSAAGGSISGSLYNQQGIMQPIYSYVWFGSNTLFYYGYVSAWDVTITHWTQYMIPMRCVINVTFTMMPTPTGAGSGNANADYNLQQITNNLIHPTNQNPNALPGLGGGPVNP
jgi:hypothetical protein